MERRVTRPEETVRCRAAATVLFPSRMASVRARLRLDAGSDGGYHFMFAPGVDGWPDAGCPGCSMFVDQIGHPAHFHARDTALALVSRAPLGNIEAFRMRMGWTLPWFSSADSDFNVDFGRTTDEGEAFGLS